MSKKDTQKETPEQEQIPGQQPGQEPQTQPEQPPAGEEAVPQSPEPEQLKQLEELKEQAARQEDKYLRLCAEYDNYRKRTAKEKEALGADVRAETAAAFLPVYDNLERALKVETADEAFKKGVEMTMKQLREVLSKLGITEIPAQGQTFDPNLHNAVMHVEDESLGENTVAEVFQAGFQCGDKVIRFAMVKVAN